MSVSNQAMSLIKSFNVVFSFNFFEITLDSSRFVVVAALQKQVARHRRVHKQRVVRDHAPALEQVLTLVQTQRVDDDVSGVLGGEPCQNLFFSFTL
jgi:hypothetical protein